MYTIGHADQDDITVLRLPLWRKIGENLLHVEAIVVAELGVHLVNRKAATSVQRLNPVAYFFHVLRGVRGNDGRWEREQAVQTSYSNLHLSTISKRDIANTVMFIANLQLLNPIYHFCPFVYTNMVLSLRGITHDGAKWRKLHSIAIHLLEFVPVTPNIDEGKLVFQYGERARPLLYSPVQPTSSKAMEHLRHRSGLFGTNSTVLKST